MKVKELKEWLELVDDDTTVIVKYSCDDDYYDYDDTIKDVSFTKKKIIFKIWD